MRALGLLVFVAVSASLACRPRGVVIDFSCSGYGPQSLRIRDRTEGAVDSRLLAEGRGGLVVHLSSTELQRGAVRAAVVDVFADSSRMRGYPLRLATTDSLGIAVLDSIAPGTYWLRSRAIGYRPTRGYVTIRAGALDTLFLSQELDVLC